MKNRSSPTAVVHEGGASVFRRGSLVSFVFLQVFSFAGIVYGWPALRIVLVKESQFSELCDTPPTGTTPCDEQALRFNLIFTVGAWAAQASRLFVGLVLDQFGILVAVTLCYFCVIPGLILLAFSSSLSFDAFIPGIFLIAFGGAGIQLANQPTSNVFPAFRTTLLTTYSGFFNASSLIFLFFLSVYNAGAEYQSIFIGYAIYATVILLAACLVLPRTRGHLTRLSPRRVFRGMTEKISASRGRRVLRQKSTPVSDSAGTRSDSSTYTSSTSLESAGTSDSNTSTTDSSFGDDGGGVSVEDASSTSRASPSLSRSVEDSESEPEPGIEPTFRSQVQTIEYILVTLFFCVHVLTLQFYIGTAGDQLERKGDTEDGTGFFYVQALVTSNAASFVVTPFLGLFIQRYGFPVAMATVNTLIIFHSFVSLFENLPVQIVAFICYGIGRVSLFATFFAFMGYTFGFKNYGRLAGLGSFLSAIVSLFQYPLLEVTINVLNGDFTFVNLIFIAAALPMYVICLYIHHVDVPSRVVSGPLHLGPTVGARTTV